MQHDLQPFAAFSFVDFISCAITKCFVCVFGETETNQSLSSFTSSGNNFLSPPSSRAKVFLVFSFCMTQFQYPFLFSYLTIPYLLHLIFCFVFLDFVPKCSCYSYPYFLSHLPFLPLSVCSFHFEEAKGTPCVATSVFCSASYISTILEQLFTELSILYPLGTIISLVSFIL